MSNDEHAEEPEDRDRVAFEDAALDAVREDLEDEVLLSTSTGTPRVTRSRTLRQIRSVPSVTMNDGIRVADDEDPVDEADRHRDQHRDEQRE